MAETLIEGAGTTPAPLPHPTVVDAGGEHTVDVAQLLEELATDQRTELDGELAVRALLLELARGRRDADRIGRLRDSVAAPYDAALERISEREATIRLVLDGYLNRQAERGGPTKVALPDAGTVYLTTKAKGGKARLNRDELEEFVEHVEELLGPNARTLYVEQLDTAKALELLLESYYSPTPAGQLVRKDTGEVVDVPGIEVTPEARELAVRLP